METTLILRVFFRWNNWTFEIV